MTSQDNQVQAIIQEIDTLLSQASPRLPWVASHETSQQRQLLERTRQYLVELQRSQSAYAALPNNPSAQFGAPEVPAETAQQVLQAVLQEVEYLRTNVMQPLRSQVDDLQRQRQRLIGEIEQVAPSAMSAAPETSAGAIPPARSASEQSIAEFLEALIGEMQQSLSEQIQQAVSQIQPQLASAPTPLLSASASDSEAPTLSPEQRLAKLQQLQQRIDQLMQELDVTLTTLSSSLQQNVESYQTSLAEGLDTMQSLGASGEPLINVLVSHLAQQLGRETSAYLQSALPWQPTDTDLEDAENLDAIATPLAADVVDAIDAIDAIASTDVPADNPIIPLASATDSVSAQIDDSLEEDIVIAESVKARALEFLNSLQANDLQFDALTNQALIMPVPPKPEAVENQEPAQLANLVASLDLASLDLELPSLADVSQVDTSSTEVSAADRQSETVEEAIAPGEEIDGADGADAIAPTAIETLEPIQEAEPTDDLDQAEPFVGADTAPQIQQTLGEFYASLLGQNNAPSLEEAVSPPKYEAIETLLNQVDLDTDLEQAIDDALQQAELLALEYAQQADATPQATSAEDSTTPSPDDTDTDDLEQTHQAQLDQMNPIDQAIDQPVEPVMEQAQTDQIDQADLIQANQDDQVIEPVAEQIQTDQESLETEPVAEQSAEPLTESETVFDWGDDFDADVTTEAVPVSEEAIGEIIDGEFEIAARDQGETVEDHVGDQVSAIANQWFNLIPTDTNIPSSASEQPPSSATHIEDLLAEPVLSPPVQSPDFLLDDDTLQQLSADLSQLEGVENLEDIDPDAASLANFSADFDVSDQPPSEMGRADAQDRAQDSPAQDSRDVQPDSDELDEAPSAETGADDTLAEFTANFNDASFTDTDPPVPLASESTANAGMSAGANTNSGITLDRFWADFPTSSADTPTQLGDESTSLEGFATDLGETAVTPSEPASSAPEAAESIESMEAVIDRLFFNLNQAEPESALESVDSIDAGMAEGGTLDEFGQALDGEPESIDITPDRNLAPEASVREEMGTTGDGRDGKEDESFTNQVLDRLFQENTSPKSETDTQTLTIDGAFGTFTVPDMPAIASPPIDQVDQANSSDQSADGVETDAVNETQNTPTDKPVEAIEDDTTDLFNGLGMEQPGHHGLDELDQHESLGESLGNIDPLDWQSSSKEMIGDTVETFDFGSDGPQSDEGTDEGSGIDAASAIASELKSENNPEINPAIAIADPELATNEITTALMTLDEPELEPASPRPLTLDPQAQDQDWYLGLDIGATGISAVLLNRQTQAQHPLFWTTTETQPSEQPQRHFRLSSTVQYTTPSDQADNHPDLQPIGLCLDLAGLTEPTEPAPSSQSAVKLPRLKPFLKYGVPYLSPAEPESGEAVLTLEPSVRWSEAQSLPLAHLQQGLQVLLETLTIQSAEAPLCCSAVALSQHTLYTALRVLSGVIVSYPTNWPDTYSFNIREAILGAQLVEDPAEIFFVDNAIAALLSALPRPDTSHAADLNVIQAHPQTVRSGNTLVLSAGALTSEFGLIELTEPLSGLNFEDFDLRSIAYGGDALDQDIVCYLLYPQAMQQIQPDQPLLPAPTSAKSISSNASGSDSGDPELSTVTSDWDFQLTYEGDLVSAWQALGLDQLALPRQGEPDLQHREHLRQRLQSSRLGQSLLQAAQHLKILLQQQAQMTIAINNIRWVIERQDFERQILLPYVQLLNRHLNTLFSKSGIATEGIRQAICTGGTASFPAIARWLRQKLPNATVIQDTYAANRPPSCSRLAYGLVNLVYYPQALDLARQQYNDYFLLLEILRSFPQQPLTIHQMMQQLERFGINTQACYFHIMALLEGHLPPGLVPAISAHSPLYTQGTAEARHKALLVQPLFHKGKGQQYIPNPAQRERLQHYLDLLLAEKHQTLAEPLITQLLVG